MIGRRNYLMYLLALPALALTAIAAGAAPPGNDACGSATAIGNGSFMGDLTEATNDGDATCGSSTGEPDVWFKYTAPAAGSVAFTASVEFDPPVISLHSSCPGTTANELDCHVDSLDFDHSRVAKSVASGEMLWVRVSQATGESVFDFDLEAVSGGSISGKVTEESSGPDLPDVRVRIYDGDGSQVSFDDTAADGTYTAHGVPDGDYRAVADSSFFAPHIDELFLDIPCPVDVFSMPTCSLAGGTAIAVAGPSDTGGKDFELAKGGAIEGKVTEDGSGDALEGVSIFVSNPDNAVVAGALTAADGTYTALGLPTGMGYQAAAISFLIHVPEIYDDVSSPLYVFDCLFGPVESGLESSGLFVDFGPGAFSGPCSGTPIPITAPDTTPGKDFSLAVAGSISGTVTEESSGDALSALVFVFDSAGVVVGYDLSSDLDGTYFIGGLPAGSDFTAAAVSTTHIDELFGGTICLPGTCDPTTGTKITIIAGMDSSGKDFALAKGGSISGTVTEVGSGDPIDGASIAIFSTSGDQVGAGTTAFGGSYAVGGLPTDSYFARATSLTHAAELWEEMPCPGGGCDPTTGTSIPVTAGAPTMGKDFTLAVGAGCPADLSLANQTLSGTESYSATSSATLGPGLVVSGTDIEVQAPTILFEGDVEIGATFIAGNSPSCP